jgi:hypothetical protein
MSLGLVVSKPVGRGTIVAAFAGTGKTTMAASYPADVLDFACLPYKYCLEEGVAAAADQEACKADFSLTMQEDWPYNYVAALGLLTGYYKYVLIPSDYWVLRLLEFEGLPYHLCYPERSAKEEYRRRYVSRGNNEGFLDVFIGRWDSFFDLLEGDGYGERHVLKAGQFLSDVYGQALGRATWVEMAFRLVLNLSAGAAANGVS